MIQLIKDRLPFYELIFRNSGMVRNERICFGMVYELTFMQPMAPAIHWHILQIEIIVSQSAVAKLGVTMPND